MEALFDHISVWQAAIMSSALLAFVIGRPRFIIISVFCANFAMSYQFGANYGTIMLTDLLCASVLMGKGPRADFVALLYALMVPLYVPAMVFGWQIGTTYAIVEVLCYLQLAIIGGVGHGYIDRRFGRDYGCGRYLPPLAQRYHAAGLDYPHSGSKEIDGDCLD